MSIDKISRTNWFKGTTPQYPAMSTKVNEIIDNVNAVLAGNTYQGVIDCSGSPNYPAATENYYWTVSVAGLIGGGAGTAVEVGDVITCIVTNLGGTEAAVGADFVITQKNMVPCTVATLRTGTNNTDFVSAKTLKDQGITTAAATIMALAGGTTQQLLLTTTAAQKGLTISSTLQTGHLIDITSTVADAAMALFNAAVTMSTAFTTAKALAGTNFSFTGGATDVDGSSQVGHNVTFVGSAGKAANHGFRASHTGTYNTAIAGVNQKLTGLQLDPICTLNSATARMYGVNIDFSGMTVTSKAFAHGIKITGVTGMDDAINITGATATGISITDATTSVNCSADGTVANARQTLLTSRDINGAVAGAVALTNYANVLGQAVSHTGGDFVVTQTASSAGILNLVMAHTTSLATAAPDVFASTALNIDIDALVNTDAGADIDVTARALDINYTLTETLGVLRLGTTDVARIDLNVPTGITSAGTFTLNMLNLDGSGYVGNDANATICGQNIDLTGVDTCAFSYGIRVDMAATITATAQYGMFVSAKGDSDTTGAYIYALNGANTNSASRGLHIDKYVMLTASPGANMTNAGYGAYLDLRNRNAAVDGSDSVNTAGGLYILTGDINTADTVVTADTSTGKAIVIEVTHSVADNAFSLIQSAAAGAIGIDYNLTKAATGVITVDSWGGAGYLGIVAIDYDATAAAGAGALTFANGTYNFFNVIASDNGTVPVYGTCTMAGYGADLSALDVTDASLSLYGLKVALPTVSASAQYGAYFSDVATNNVSVLSNLSGINMTMVTTSSVGINVLADETLISNNKKVIVGSRDLVGAIAADRNLSNYSVDFSQNVDNQTAGNFDITNGAGLMSLTSTHTVTTGGATGKADADTFSGSTLYIHNHATTVAQADSLLTTTSKAIEIVYDVTKGAASTHNLNSTSIIGVDLNVAATTAINSVAPGVIAVLKIDANGFIPGATVANDTVIAGAYIDYTDTIINDANASLYGYKVIMPYSNDNTTNAINAGFCAFIDTNTNIANANKAIYVSDAFGAAAVQTNTTMVLDYVGAYTTNGGNITCQTNPLMRLAVTLTETANVLTFGRGFLEMSTTVGAGTPTIYGDMVKLTVAGTNDQAQTLRGYNINADGVILDNAAANFYGIHLDASGLTNTLSSVAYGAYFDAPTCDVALKVVGWSQFDDIESTKYSWKEDFDEEVAAVTLAAGLRGDEWVLAGTFASADDVTYVAGVGGAIAGQTDGGNDDSLNLTHVCPTVNIGANPIFECRFKVDVCQGGGADQMVCAYVGLVETGGFVDKANIEATTDDFILVGIDTDNAHGFGFNAIIIATDNAGGSGPGGDIQNTGQVATNDTYITVRIDTTDVNQPRVWVNPTGGAILPTNEVPPANITGTIKDNIVVYPQLFVQALDANDRTMTVDYVKVWSARV